LPKEELVDTSKGKIRADKVHERRVRIAANKSTFDMGGIGRPSIRPADAPTPAVAPKLTTKPHLRPADKTTWRASAHVRAVPYRRRHG
jgi:hypothetical protein